MSCAMPFRDESPVVPRSPDPTVWNPEDRRRQGRHQDCPPRWSRARLIPVVSPGYGYSHGVRDLRFRSDRDDVPSWDHLRHPLRRWVRSPLHLDRERRDRSWLPPDHHRSSRCRRASPGSRPPPALAAATSEPASPPGPAVPTVPVLVSVLVLRCHHHPPPVLLPGRARDHPCAHRRFGAHPAPSPWSRTRPGATWART